MQKRYVIVNSLTGLYAYDGKIFRTKRGVLRAVRKLQKTPFGAVLSQYLEIKTGYIAREK